MEIIPEKSPRPRLRLPLIAPGLAVCGISLSFAYSLRAALIAALFLIAGVVLAIIALSKGRARIGREGMILAIGTIVFLCVMIADRYL